MTGGLLAAFCLTLPLLAGCGSGSGAPDRAEGGKFHLADLKRCDRPHLPDRMLCDTTVVDLEREDPSLGQITIAFGILPSRKAQNEKRDGLLAIEGGPGYGSVGGTSLYQRLFDNVTSPAEGRATAALFPNAEFFLNPNGGHVFGEYYPNSPVARRIREFLLRNP